MNAMLLFAALKVLAIGNSFSVSLQSQLPSVAKALGQDLDLATMLFKVEQDAYIRRAEEIACRSE